MGDVFFLGLDYSTQQLKSLIFDDTGKLINEEIVDFDVDLQHYGTVNGVYPRDDGVILAPSAMWIEATDILFNKLSVKFDLGKIAALSGSAQQHTSIFWATGASVRIANFDSNKLLLNQISEIFSQPLSPTWMDSSTLKECKQLEDLFGGRSEFQLRTGSSLSNRFSGPQIMKAFSIDKTLDNRTEAITLVSNGMCSIFSGKLVGMDASDAAGTGLQKCGLLDWDSEICLAISGNLESKLGRIVHSNSVTGYLNDYFVKRYRMNPRCQVVTFTGDNPSSVVGMQLNEGNLCLSMGTSDTLFACLPKKPTVVSDIPLFVFPHPLCNDTFVTLLCYKNGARVRQRICHQYCGDNWDQFSLCLEETVPGNNGVFGLFFDDEEITPPGFKGRHFYSQLLDRHVEEKDIEPRNLVRSLIEGQILSKYFHFNSISSGLIASPISKLLVTGGASVNKSILQVVADIFNVPLYSVDVANSAALGSVIRAVMATENQSMASEFNKRLTTLRLICQPQNHDVYKAFEETLFEFCKF